MRVGILLMLLGAISACSAAVRDDLLHLCDLSESFYRAEAHRVGSGDASLRDFAQLLLIARLHAIVELRKRVAELPEATTENLKVREGSLCGFTLGNGDPWLVASAERQAMFAYLQRHPEIDTRYVAATEKVEAEVLNEAKIIRGEYLQILRRYIPADDSDPPNQALEPTPKSVTDRADARPAPAMGVAHH